LEVSQTPTLDGDWVIPYSRYLVGNPLDYNGSVAGLRRCPIIQGRYSYVDADISSVNTASMVGTTWQIVMTTWDIDAVGSARIGDTLQKNGSDVIGTITEVIETATTLTLKVANPINIYVTTNLIVDLYPRNRGNFGPIVVRATNIYLDTVTEINYQPPTTAGNITSGDNYFTVDASEVLKTAFAGYHGQPFSPSLEDYRMRVIIDLYLDGVQEDSWVSENALDGTVAYPVPSPYLPISNVCSPRLGNDPNLNPLVRMRWSVAGQNDVWVQPYLIGTDGVPFLPDGLGTGPEPCNEITCADYDFLSVGLHYIQLVWLNPYGGFDTWLFSYGEPGLYGGNTPRHNYTAGKSQLARRDFDITQVNRGIQQQNYEFNSGMIPVELAPVLEGLHGSPLVFMLPIGAAMATVYDYDLDRYSFSLIDQPELIRVMLEDQDWQDSLIGYPATSFSATVVIANITNTQIL
jgi:hypothetical protein